MTRTTLHTTQDEPAHIDRERVWLMTYIALFTSLLAFFILAMNLVSIEQNSQKRNFQKAQSHLEYLSRQLKQRYQLTWLHIENTVTKGIRFTLQPNDPQDELFALGSDKLNPVWQQRLALLADLLDTIYQAPLSANAQQPFHLNLLIEGHTDAQPMHSARFPSNWELSTARAEYIQRLLSQKTHIPPAQFAIAGLGSFRPKQDIQQYADNRRIEIYLKLTTPSEQPTP